MKKFIVKYKDSGKVFGEFTSKEEASDKVMEYINGHYISPFDFELEEVECKEVNEVITDFESAKKYLVGNTNDDFIVVKRSHYENTIQLKDVAKLLNEIAPKHLEALIALNELFTITEAWNKSDRFAPDFLDIKQKKWFPKFKYDKDAAGFVYFHTDFLCSVASATFGQRICFKTSERAEQFGKQFTHLYNKVFLSK